MANFDFLILHDLENVYRIVSIQLYTFYLSKIKMKQINPLALLLTLNKIYTFG